MSEERAYMIIFAQISDRTAFLGGYSKATSELVETYGGRYILRAPGVKLLEGNWGAGASVAISEWPNEEAIEAFWNSSEYAEIKKLREEISDVQVMVISASKFSSN